MPIFSPRYKLTQRMVHGAPGEAGVYALWEDAELVYLGRASATVTIRERLMEHLAGGGCPCARSASHYTWELSLEPAVREAQALDEFRARFGRLPRCNEEAA